MRGHAGCRALIIPVSPGPYSLDSLLSSVLRGVEEYGADLVYLVYTERVAGQIRSMIERVKEAIGCVDFVEEQVCDWVEGARESCNTTLRLREVITKAVERCGEGNVAVIISPASRRLAAAISLASLPQSPKNTTASTAVEVEVAHVDFYWGPWTGAVYPFVPRGLEPVIRIHPANAVAREARSLEDCGSAVAEPRQVDGGLCVLPNGRRLPPIACSVAKLARRLNLAGGRYYVDPEGGFTGGCRGPDGGPALRVEIAVSRGVFNGRPSFRECFRVQDLCDARYVKDAVERAVRCVYHEIALPVETEKEPDKSKAWQLVMYTGLVPPVVEEPEELKGRRLGDALAGGRVIIDTNMAYAGIHIEALKGLQVAVPSCAIMEVAGRLSERLKSPPSLWTFIDILAFAALEELRLSGAKILETPGAAKCEAGIMALSSGGEPLATRDWGALKLWRLAARIKDSWPGSLVFVKTPNFKEALELARGLPLPDAYYALLQLLVVLKAASRYLQGKREHSIHVRVTGLIDEGMVPVPRSLKMQEH